MIYDNIYILSVVALDETNISGCLHFLMQNIDMSQGGVTSTSDNNDLRLSTFA